MAKKKTRFYVAVVATNLLTEPLIRSARTCGDYASFIGMDQDVVTERALAAAKSWGDTYNVYVGELSGWAKPLYKVTRI